LIVTPTHEEGRTVTTVVRDQMKQEGLITGQEHVVGRAKDRAERIRALSGIMRELGYQSGSIDPANEKLPAIEAKNCVFHSLAQRYPEVCYFDLALISEVVGSDVIHDECMARGGKSVSLRWRLATSFPEMQSANQKLAARYPAITSLK